MTAHSNSPDEGRGNHPRTPLPPIKFKALADALLANVDSLLPQWLPGGCKRGHEWVCGSLAGGKGSSFSVNMTNGRWGEFSGDEKGGDLLSLYAAIHKLSMAKAAVEVAREEGLEDVAGVMTTPSGAPVPPRPPRHVPPPTPKPREREGWKSVRPVPDMAPAPTFKHYDRAPETLTHTFEYRTGADALHGYVVRFRTSDGDKETLPYTWCQSAMDGAMKWHWKQWDEPRPLYLPGKVLPTSAELAALTVVVVEGERKADVLQALLDTHAPTVYLVVSWPGGSNAWAKADWAWLLGARTVLLWPDCDALREKPTQAERKACESEEALEALKASKPIMPEPKQPGTKAMVGIGNHLHGLLSPDSSISLLRIPAPGDKPSGWDAADAIETDGWGADEVLVFFGTAYPCPPVGGEANAPADAPVPKAADGGGKGGGGKKIDSPVGTDGDGSDNEWLWPFWNKKKQYWMVSRELVIAALHNDPDLQDVIGLDVFARRIVARRDWPWQHGKSGDLTNTTDLMLARYLSERYGLPSIVRGAVYEALETVSFERQFHPVQDYLQARQWDKKKRLDKWLVYALGETPGTLKPAVYEYLCLVGRYWLLGMVYRAMEPGSKFDYCPVVEGAGGLRKSTLIETLAGSDWYSATPFDVGRGKEGQDQVQGRWLYEIAELAHFGKTDVELIKAFISEKVDRYRPSYGRVVEAFPRQCVLSGTTNQRKWLRDRTGNRRFWPIPVRHVINIEWVERHRDQLMAEAFELYLQGEPCYPDAETETRLFVPMQEKRMLDSTMTDALMHVLTRPPGAGSAQEVNNLETFVSSHMMVTALGIDPGKTNSGLDSQLRGWLEQQGWVYRKKQINGVRTHGWERPKDWPPESDAMDTDEYQEPTQGAQPGVDGNADEQEPDDAPF